MKKFFNYFFASLLAMCVAGLIFFIVFFSVIGALISKQEKAETVKSDSFLVLKLDKPIRDRRPVMPFEFSPFGRAFTSQVHGLNDILGNIKKAAADDKITGICLDLSTIQAGIASIEEIREALEEFKKSGKPVIGYADHYFQASYYLASVSDKVFLNPEGSVFLTGLRAELLFFRKTFEKLGIKPQVIRHGKFKSAVEPLTSERMSVENREQIRAFTGSIWRHMVDKISESRGKTSEEVNHITDNLDLIDSRKALGSGFIDSLVYRDELIEYLKGIAGIADKTDPELVSHEQYIKVPAKRKGMGLEKNKVAIIYAAGEIGMGNETEGSIGAHKMATTIREARKDSSIKAIVFRVNSPGGSALASEIIWREIFLARQVKPVIASMGDMAASGGYYIVAAADTIVASPVTITGSIGVFGVFFNMEEFFNQKLGITSDVEKTNRSADIGSPFRELTPAEVAVVGQSIDRVYETFVNHVVDGRGMTFSQVDQIAEGRVWSGIDAQLAGLTDLQGGLNRAVEVAAAKAGLDTYRIVELPKMEDPFQKLLGELKGNLRTKAIAKELGDDYRYYQLLNRARRMHGIQALMPFEISLN